MKKSSLCIVFMFVGLFFLGVSKISAQNKKAILWAPEDMKWKPMQGPPGVMTVDLWGNQNKGAYGGLTKFPADFKAPLHYHTNDIKIVVIQGAYTYNGKEYGPGSYVFIPGGVKHESGGVANSETIFFIEQPGKFDIQQVGSQKKKK